MTAAFIALLALSLVVPGLLIVAWHLDGVRRDQLLREIRAEHVVERGQWMDERRELLNRIKPETAQPLPRPQPAPAPPQPALDDDQQVWAALNGLSVEEFAERMVETERQMAEATGDA